MAFFCKVCGRDFKDMEIDEHLHFNRGNEDRVEAQHITENTRVDVLSNVGTVTRVEFSSNHSVRLTIITDDNQIIHITCRPTTMIRTM